MAVPKKRTSRSRRNMRRAHDFLTRTYAVVCQCGEPVLRHRVCMNCGQYRGRQLIKVQDESAAAAE